MSHNILLTGASGYLGGTILTTRQNSIDSLLYNKFYALVRTDSQASSVREFGAHPLTFDVKNEAAVYKTLVEKQISIVLFMIDAMSSSAQSNFIKALAEVKRKTGREVHFMHVSVWFRFKSRISMEMYIYDRQH